MTSIRIRATSRWCPGAKSQLAVPLRNKGQVIGALNLLSDKLGAFTERDEWILRQFGAHVAQAIATARLLNRNASTRRRSKRSPRSAAR